MPRRTVLATLNGKGPCERLQVSLSQTDDGRLLIDLREQHHADGIGWFDQRRLELDPRQFEQIQGILALKSETLKAAAQEQPATVPFPGPAPTISRRTAVGGRE
jgi:hypothetical protein